MKETDPYKPTRGERREKKRTAKRCTRKLKRKWSQEERG